MSAVYAIVKHENLPNIITFSDYEIIDIRDCDVEAWAIAHALEDHPDNHTVRLPYSSKGLYSYYVQEYPYNGLTVPK